MGKVIYADNAGKVKIPTSVVFPDATEQTTATKEIFVFPTMGTNTYAVTKTPYTTIELGAAEYAYFMFKCPHDFTALTHCKVLGIKITDGTIDWTANTAFAAIGEDYYTHTDSDTGDGLAMVFNEIEEVDITAAFANLAADDIVGVRFKLDAISAGTYHIGGLIFRYS